MSIKLVLFVVIVLMAGLDFPNYCRAQVRIEFGAKAGISVPDLTSGSKANPISEGYSSRLDGYGAIFFEFLFHQQYGIQTELAFSGQGGKKNGVQAFKTPNEMMQQFPPGQAPTYLYADYNSEARFYYLMLPILGKYHFNTRPKWDIYLAAGPFGSYLIKARNITKGASNIYLDEARSKPLTQEPQSFDNTNNITSDLHRFNFGFSGQVGFGYYLSGGSAFVEAGGNYGLIDIQKDPANGRNKTGAAVICLGYQLTL